MTDSINSVTSINRTENLLAFQLLEEAGFDPESRAKVDNISLDLTDTDDDVVMLHGTNIEINANEGNNTVVLSGDNNKITTTGEGENVLGLYGTNSSVSSGSGNDNIYLEGDNLSATTTGGKNTFRLYGNNSTINAEGRNYVGFIGNSNTITLGDARQSKVGYWGNNNNITVGSGGANVSTLDWEIKRGQFTDMEDRWVDQLSYHNSSEKTNSEVYYDYASCDNSAYIALSDDDLAYAETVDLTEVVNNCPKYVVGGTVEADEDDTNTYASAGVLYVYSYSYKGDNYYYPVSTVGTAAQESSKVIINTVQGQEANYYTYEDYTMVYSKNYEVNGVSGNKITFGDGDNTLKQTLASGYQPSVDMGTATTGHTLKQETAYTFATQSSHDFSKTNAVTKQFYVAV